MADEREMSNKVRSVSASRAMLAATLATVAGTSLAVACAESSGEPPQTDEPDAHLIEVADTGAQESESDADVDAGCGAIDSSLCAPPTCEGVDWCPVQNPADTRRAFTSVWGTGKNDVWAVGSGGAVIHFDGTEWKDSSLPTTRTLFSVGGSGPDDVWIVGTYGTLYHGPGLVNGTAHWESVPIVPYSGAEEKLLSSVWSPSPDQVWITGESLRIPGQSRAATQYRGSVADGGTKWQAISPCPSCTVMARVWGTSPTNIWSVGQKGKAFRTVEPQPGDGGVGDAAAAAPVWTDVDSQSTEDLRAVWGSSKDDVWAVGRRGTVRRYRDEATQAEVVAAGTTEDLHAVWGSAPNDVWAVGDYGTILHFDGTSWQRSTASLPVGRKPHLYGVWGSAEDDVWVVGEGIVLHFTGAKK
ncbi:MAG: hypothetical protein BGO98_24615 [Myxococcales bacterium 68-20]|nr:MAG: hypothetical protein BGO98_24615 [Myxococcales bacterium 68-20]